MTYVVVIVIIGFALYSLFFRTLIVFLISQKFKTNLCSVPNALRFPIEVHFKISLFPQTSMASSIAKNLKTNDVSQQIQTTPHVELTENISRLFSHV